MSDYPTAEEELKVTTLRLWSQVDVTEQLIKERDELRTLARELRDVLRMATDECLWRSDSPTPLSTDDSQRIYNVATEALTKAEKFKL